METLLNIWETVSGMFRGLARTAESSITGLFGTSNARYLKRLQPKLQAINALEPSCRELTTTGLKQQTDKFRKRLADGETLDDLLIEAFAVCREAARRVLGMRHFDVQLLGGMVLCNGHIAEMATGEGKTLVATLPVYLNAIEGQGVHVVTVNDYLARRDMEWMGRVFMALGLSVGAVERKMDTAQRQQAYQCDITYGTNNEFGFDYLRDAMRPASIGDDRYPRDQQQCQRRLHYAVIDEVDSILIDEARTPLIIAGPACDDAGRYTEADRIVRELDRDVHFEVQEEDHLVFLTDDGMRLAERLAGVENFYTAENMEWPHFIDAALKAHHLYRCDVDYVVKQGKVVIVDQFTGRLLPGRNWRDGLHQAVQAKEGVPIKKENQTLATVSRQNYFKLYDKICGMTGTAITEAGEFWDTYRLDVITIPTNRPLQRAEHADVIYATEDEKYAAVIAEIERIHGIPGNPRQGRPVLVGTVSIEKSERISRMLDQRGIEHQVLNAKHHQREADIIAQAGRRGAVTIATNMAGRGTDIILGGNAEALAWAQLRQKYATRLDVPDEQISALVEQIEQHQQMKAEGRQVARMGGLHVIGTERHEARRIDLQLRGRSGRQGDPGSSRFFLSLEDDLMRVFDGQWVEKMLARPEMSQGGPIEKPRVSRRIEATQQKIEERNFATRRRLLEYDEVINEQRTRVYGYRQQILDGADCKQLILEMARQRIEHHFEQFLTLDYGTDSFAQWAARMLSVSLTPHDFCGLDFDSAEALAKDKASRQAEGQLLETIAEDLPEDIQPGQCDWEALAQVANHRWKLDVQQHDLSKVGREGVSELLLDKIREAVRATDLSRGARFFQHDFGIRAACDWLQQKFAIELNIEEVRKLKPAPLKACAWVRVEGISREMEERSGGEMQRIERRLVLQVLDAAWKDHLLALDRLRSSVGLRSYARVDPLVEYKREGMRMFSEMWDFVGERITDLFFRVQHVEQGFAGSLRTDLDAMDKDIPSPSETSEQE